MTAHRFASDDEDSGGDDSFIARLKAKRKRRNSNNCKRDQVPKACKTLAVVDLDDTLIDSNFIMFPLAQYFLRQLKKNCFVLLWTFGNEKHVQEFFKAYPDARTCIDLVRCGRVNGLKPVNEARSFVYSKIKKYFEKSILIDDDQNNLKFSCYDHSFNPFQQKGTVPDYVRLWENIQRIL